MRLHLKVLLCARYMIKMRKGLISLLLEQKPFTRSQFIENTDSIFVNYIAKHLIFVL